ncbi:MAG: transcription termination/antitermination protein NusG [Crocinitomicaceae bacterium]|nr:transcription termination/antitermination protein NusG [Crocinitomicaceae bacterium]MBK8926292.1 transcription termination/antitermination protein NusG [Crocinitomicaceae bacterium]
MAEEKTNKNKPTGDEKKLWYVVRAVGGKEKKVRDSIEMEIKRHKLEHLVGQVLIPTEKVYQIKNGKKISKERSYLPGYVLLEAVLDGEVQHMINNVPNVIGFMSGTKGGEPMPMRVSEVNRILGKVDELSEHEEELNIPYVIGETVKVIDGPFNGFNGVIEEINEEKKKLQVMVKIFGRKTPLELSYMQVDKSN